MKLADEDAWEIGFSCAGDLDVLIEPLDLTNPVGNLLDSYRAIRNAVDHGKHAVLVTSLKDSSSKLLVFESGETTGTLGTPELDREAQAHCARARAQARVVNCFSFGFDVCIFRSAWTTADVDRLWRGPRFDAVNQPRTRSWFEDCRR